MIRLLKRRPATTRPVPAAVGPPAPRPDWSTLVPAAGWHHAYALAATAGICPGCRATVVVGEPLIGVGNRWRCNVCTPMAVRGAA